MHETSAKYFPSKDDLEQNLGLELIYSHSQVILQLG